MPAAVRGRDNPPAMPTYMDRHDLEGATPQDVAGAHQQDLWKQADYDVRMLTYWYDEARGSVFCLAEAPSEDAVVSLHRDAHGQIPHKIPEVDPRAVTSFLGAIVDPEPGTPWAMSAFRTILFTDIVGSTSLFASLGDVAAKDSSSSSTGPFGWSSRRPEGRSRTTRATA